jgi:hypothetical protein
MVDAEKEVVSVESMLLTLDYARLQHEERLREAERHRLAAVARATPQPAQTATARWGRRVPPCTPFRRPSRAKRAAA